MQNIQKADYLYAITRPKPNLFIFAKQKYEAI